MTGRSRAIDEAGNDVGTALGLGQLSGKASYAGAIDPFDRADMVYAGWGADDRLRTPSPNPSSSL